MVSEKRITALMEVPDKFFQTLQCILKMLLRVPISDSNCGLKVSPIPWQSQRPIPLRVTLIVPLLRIRGYDIEEVQYLCTIEKAGSSKYYTDGVS